MSIAFLEAPTLECAPGLTSSVGLGNILSDEVVVSVEAMVGILSLICSGIGTCDSRGIAMMKLKVAKIELVDRKLSEP